MKIKHFFTIFINLLFLQISYSQDFKKIEYQNVAFIHLKDFKSPEVKKNVSSHKVTPEIKACTYYFYHYNQENELYKMPFLRLHYTIPDSKAKDKKYNPIVFRVYKSFLKKNKNIIIDLEFIKKIGATKTLDLLRNIKTIFIIDETDDVKRKEILIKEVKLIPNVIF